MDELNRSPACAEAAKHWEGDFHFVVEPGGTLDRRVARRPARLEPGAGLQRQAGPDARGRKVPWLLRQPLPAGGQAGHVPDVEPMLREHYEARSWHPTTGQPTRQTLASPGLALVNA